MAGYEGTPAEELNPYAPDRDAPGGAPFQGKTGKPITEKQRDLLNGRLKQSSKSVEELKAYCLEAFGIEGSRDMTMDQLDETLVWLSESE